jgi:hypothetical protein
LEEVVMGKESFHARREQLAEEAIGEYRSRKAAFGPITASFESIPAGFPPYGPELYEGLPQRACQVAHMGYVFRGQMKFAHVDGTEQVVGPGEAYYVPPGHQWDVLEDAEIVEFSPTDELARHMENVAGNLERLERAPH